MFVNLLASESRLQKFFGTFSYQRCKSFLCQNVDTVSEEFPITTVTDVYRSILDGKFKISYSVRHCLICFSLVVIWFSFFLLSIRIFMIFFFSLLTDRWLVTFVIFGIFFSSVFWFSGCIYDCFSYDSSLFVCSARIKPKKVAIKRIIASTYGFR